MAQRDFHHPYTPYAIQLQFMNAVYECLENEKVAILESPTGTGKSLSLICGALTWLRNYKRRALEGTDGHDNEDNSEPDWMVQHATKQHREAAVQRKADLELRLSRIRAKEERARARFEAGEPAFKKQRMTDGTTTSEASVADEAAFLLADYESEDEAQQAAHHDPASGLSAETQALIEKLKGDLGHSKDSRDDEDAPDDELKIFFCSRTHSQLSQLVTEMRKPKFPPSVPSEEAQESSDKKAEDSNEESLVEYIKQISLGSRKNLCINPKVAALGHPTLINERCLELQQPGAADGRKCQFLPRQETEVLVNDFRDHALAKVQDIEELGNLGRKLQICPYYASRAAVKPSEVVTLPYPLLLQKSAREALGISLKDHVVVIDEAHNLMDAISNVYSMTTSLSQLRTARAQILVYLQKFRNKLKGKNRIYITQTVRVLDSLVAYLESRADKAHPSEAQAVPSDLLSGKGVDQVNLYKLMHYLQESKLAWKVDGYNTFTEEQSATASLEKGARKRVKRSATPVLMYIQSFLQALTNPAAEGRFFYSRSVAETVGAGQDIVLRYLLLDPTPHFRDIVEECRALVLAGGTLSPMDEFTSNLFQYLSPDKIMTLSCGHVVPKTSLLAMVATKGVRGVDFEFTHGNRESRSMFTDLGQSILELARVVPDGLVVFFPSYSMLRTAIRIWRTAASGSSGNAISTSSDSSSIWQQIESQKRIFMEPNAGLNVTNDSNDYDRGGASQGHSTQSQQQQHADTPAGADISADALLAAYAAFIRSNRQKNKSTLTSKPSKGGAILFAVISGSLSEGINFSDELGRCVVVVGLPFPSPTSAEWTAKMEFARKRATAPTLTSTNTGVAVRPTGDAGRQLALNATMRAVNQSIGRAIRHKDDYAAIVLMDKRYERDDVRSRLPGWIKESLVAPGQCTTDGSFRAVVGRVQAFFAGRETL